MAGCDTSVDLYGSTQPFSIVGVLDAGVDTQFVRVTATDDSMAFGTTRQPFRGTVRTEHLASGRTTTWNDSLVQFEFVEGVGEREERWVHNFWTTAAFEPNETYRFTVTGPNGRSSSATVTLPDPLRAPVITAPGPFNPQWGITFEDADPLADLKVLLTTEQSPDLRTVQSLSLLPDTMRTGGDLSVMLPTSDLSDAVSGEIVDQQLRFVAAGPEWPGPDIQGLREEAVLAPGTISNVTNGFGYLAGTATRTIPLAQRSAEGDE
jgi:hypothetical protein